MAKSLVKWDADGIAQWAASAPKEGAVLVHSLRGFLDAGKAGAIVAEHLRGLDSVKLASFDIDALLDYRSRRPEMTFSVNEWTAYDEPYLDLDMVHDGAGTPFLLLHGFEPDVKWERYILSVRNIVEKLGVGLTLGAHGIPMASPHTRPISVTVHGTRQEPMPDFPSLFGTVTVPASAQNLMEYRFGQWDIAAINVAVHVPHYLAQSAYPQAAQRALRELEGISGLELSPAELDEAAERAQEEIDRQMGESEEIQALVGVLESQYDAFQEQRGAGIPVDGPLPSADELGEEFEKFLAQQRWDLPPGQ